MEKNEIIEKLKNVPYISRQDVSEKLWGRFNDLKTALLSGNGVFLNTHNVTGIWYMKNLMFEEGNPQILLRSSVTDIFDNSKLNAEIWNIILNDTAYDYDEDLIKGTSMLIGEKEKLERELVNGGILAVYDKDRE